MKKLFSLLAALALVITLAACSQVDPEIIYETVIEYVDVPGDTIYVEVPGEEIEVIVEIPGETITVEVIVEVPTNVENTRFYKPGVYFNNTEIAENGFYTYSVVIVDTYGKIAGIMFDETKTTSEFLVDEDGQLYVYIEGDGKSVPHTYRAIASNADFTDYPTASDAITANDLVVGIHQAEIAELSAIVAHESRQILGDDTWVGQTDLLISKIIADQTTYGVDTATSGNLVTAINVPGMNLTNVDELLALVQEILIGAAALEETDVLATTPVSGLYEAGYEFGVTGRLVGSSVSYYTSFVAVDAYGRIAGVYADATLASDIDGGHATKWILGEEGYPLPGGWDTQARAYGEAVVKNQGNPFQLFDSKDYDNGISLPGQIAGGFDFAEGVSHAYTDQIAGSTIGMEGIITATEAALTNLVYD